MSLYASIYLCAVYYVQCIMLCAKRVLEQVHQLSSLSMKLQAFQVNANIIKCEGEKADRKKMRESKRI